MLFAIQRSTEIWKAESARMWTALKMCNYLVLFAKIVFQAPWLADVQAPSYYNSEQILGLQNVRETRIYKYVFVVLVYCCVVFFCVLTLMFRLRCAAVFCCSA